MIACSAMPVFVAAYVFFLIAGDRERNLSLRSFELESLEGCRRMMSITLRNSFLIWSGAQKIWASSCVKPRTRVRP